MFTLVILELDLKVIEEEETNSDQTRALAMRFLQLPLAHPHGEVALSETSPSYSSNLISWRTRKVRVSTSHHDREQYSVNQCPWLIYTLEVWDT